MKGAIDSHELTTHDSRTSPTTRIQLIIHYIDHEATLFYGWNSNDAADSFPGAAFNIPGEFGHIVAINRVTCLDILSINFYRLNSNHSFHFTYITIESADLEISVPVGKTKVTTLAQVKRCYGSAGVQHKVSFLSIYLTFDKTRATRTIDFGITKITCGRTRGKDKTNDYGDVCIH